LAYERYVLARRRRRRRRQQRMLWLLTGVTTAVLLVIAWMISEIAPVPTTASPAALEASGPASAGAAIPGVGRATGTARPRASPSARPKALPSPGVPYPRVTDYSSGLSFRLFGSPWRHGCPSVLQTPMFSWSAGENAVAGNVLIGGSAIEWHANACSGQLQQQFAYTGPANLEATAKSLVDALEPPYYAGIQHYLTVQDSSPMSVSGDRAWVVRFEVSYYPDPGQGVTWGSELGAVVVVDRGPDRVPAVFYVSVPDKFNTTDVDTLIRSLRVTS
jgi:hypothetical protein